MARITIASLQADIKTLRELVKDVEALRVKVAQLEEDKRILTKERDALMTAAHVETPRNDQRVVSRWTDCAGQAWVKVRTGWNTCAIRRVEAA